MYKIPPEEKSFTLKITASLIFGVLSTLLIFWWTYQFGDAFLANTPASELPAHLLTQTTTFAIYIGWLIILFTCHYLQWLKTKTIALLGLLPVCTLMISLSLVISCEAESSFSWVITVSFFNIITAYIVIQLVTTFVDILYPAKKA